MSFKISLLVAFLAGLLLPRLSEQEKVLIVDLEEMEEDYVDLLPYSMMYIDSTRKMVLDDMRGVQMYSAEGLDTLDRKADEFEYPVWLKINIRTKKSVESGDMTLYIQNGILMEFYQVTADTVYSGKAGWDVALNGINTANARFGFVLNEMKMVPQEIFIRIYGYTTDSPLIRLYRTDRLDDYQKADYYENRYRISYYAALVALLVMTGIFFLFRYQQFSERYLLWYGIYLIAIGFNILSQYELLGHTSIFWDFLPINGHLNTVYNGVPWIFFGLYLVNILEIKQAHPLYVAFKRYMGFLILAINTALILTVMRYVFFVRIPFGYFHFFYLISAVLFTVLGLKIFNQPERINKLIGTGMLILSITIIIYSIGRTLMISGNYYLIVEFGLLIDIFFLNQAIGLKMKQTAQALVNTQNNLLLSEKKTLQTQQKLNEELNRLVEQKTQKILDKNKALVNQEKLKLEAEFNQKIAHAELKALKAQMNPHFIFNCLNAIRNLVQKGDSDQASEYLADFASFIRKVLSYSEVKRVSLEEELALCELYLKMEQLRFEDGFEYEIKVASETATDFIMLPPMLLQPLLENAIWHGLLHKKGDRKLMLSIFQTDKEVICTIDDNGVGREFSSSIKNPQKRESIGLKLFMERLDINNRLLQYNYTYEIIDKYENQTSTGTKVNLFFEL